MSAPGDRSDPLRAVAERLVARHAGADPDRAAAIRREVTAAAEGYRGAAITTFVPILVERSVQRRLISTPNM